MDKCDCLNWCGDDTRVEDRKVKPCKQWLRDQSAIKERQRVIDMVTALAKTASDNGTVYVSAIAMDDIWRLIKGLPTRGVVPNATGKPTAANEPNEGENA